MFRFISRTLLKGLAVALPIVAAVYIILLLVVNTEKGVKYVQWGYQLGGFCFVVPRDAVRPVDMSVEDGLRWALTAGVSAPAKAKKKEEPGTDTRAGTNTHQTSS